MGPLATQEQKNTQVNEKIRVFLFLNRQANLVLVLELIVEDCIARSVVLSTSKGSKFTVDVSIAVQCDGFADDARQILSV